MDSGQDACIVIAAYKEVGNLKRLIPILCELLPQAKVVIVDDSSPDGTPEMLNEMAAVNPALVPVIRPKKMGYGSAVLAGFRQALDLGAQRIVTMDADFSHNPEDVPRLLEGLGKYSVAIGSRYYQGVRVLDWHVSRLLLSLFANRYVRTILGFRVEDATSGFRAYRREPIEVLASGSISSQGYSFLVEILYCLYKRGFTLGEVPIIYAERREGQSKMSKKVIWEAAFRPWLLRIRGVRRGR